MNNSRLFSIDLAERVAWTFIQGFLAIWLAPVVADILNGGQSLISIWGSVSDLSVLDKAAVGGIAAVLAAFKGAIAKHVGSPLTAATLPVEDDTPKAV